MNVRALAIASALCAVGPAALAQEATPLDSPAAPPAEPLARVPRVAIELVLGTAGAAATAYGGYQLGCALTGGGAIATDCTTASLYGAVIGFGLGIPVGVMLGGALMDGDGGLLPTAFGAGVGLAAAVGAAVFLQRTALSPDLAGLLALPLVFAVAGYELSSPDSRTASGRSRTTIAVLPLGSATHRGLAVGVRF